MKKTITFNQLKKFLKESFTYSGTLHFDKNGKCYDKKAIASVWWVIEKYPRDEETKVIDGTTYLYCITLTSEWSSHFWAVYPGCDNPNEAKNKLPEYLTKSI